MNKTLLSYASLLLLVCLMAVSAQAQLLVNPKVFEEYNFDFTGAGARAAAMGGAYVALSDDVTGATWNPAGIYHFEKPVFGITFRSMGPRGSSSIKDDWLIRFPFRLPELALSNSLDHSGSFNSVSSFSFVAPIRVKGHQFVGTIIYGNNSDEYATHQVDILRWRPQVIFRGPGWFDIFWYPTDLTWVSEMQGNISSVNIGFGTRFYKSTSFGATVNIYSGQTVRHLKALETINHFPYQSNQTIRGRVNQDIIDSTQFSGFNFTLGFKQDGERLDAALVIKTAFNLNAKIGQSIYTVTDFKGEDSAGDPNGDWLQSPGFTDTIFFDNMLTKYSMPLMVSAGVAFQQTEKLILAAGVDYRRYSSRVVQHRDSIFIDPAGKGTEFFTPKDPEWSNVFAFTAGTEYLFDPSIGEIPLRFGIGVTPIPAPSREVLGEKKTSISYSLSGGTGIHWNQISLDFAYTYRSWDRTTETYYSEDPRGIDFVLLPTELKMRNHSFTFSFTGVF